MTEKDTEFGSEPSSRQFGGSIDRIPEWIFEIDQLFDAAPERLVEVIARHPNGTWDSGEVMLTKHRDIASFSGFANIIYDSELAQKYSEGEIVDFFVAQLEAWIANTFNCEHVRH